MNCNPTLTAEEFSGAHNAMCQLRNLQERHLGTEMGTKLAQILKSFETAFENAYKQDDAAFERKSDHYRHAATMLKLESTWSIMEVEDLTLFHNWGPEPRELVYTCHWGKNPVVVDIPGRTWLDLYKAADEAIRLSGDSHHCFIEGFRLNPDGQLELSTGS